MPIKDYLVSTSSLFYSFLFTLPLFLIYEVGLILSSRDDMVQMRNGADALLRQILSTVGLHGFYWMGGIFFLGILLVFFSKRKSWQKRELSFNYLAFMSFESFIYAYLLFIFMSNVHLLLMNPSGHYLVQQVTLAIGAGLYEEILFRVLLITSIARILCFIFQWDATTGKWIAMIISAGIFSSFHFIGEFGDYYSFNIFMVRFFAGIILGILYFFRGFGIVSWSHALYDLIVLIKITTVK